MKKLIPILQSLIYTTYLAELLPFSTSLFFLKKIKDRGVKVFFFYVSAMAFFLCLSLYFKIIAKDLVHWILVNRIFLFVEFALLSTYYYYNLQWKYRKNFLWAATIAFFIYSVLDYLAAAAGTFNFIPLVVECLFFALLIIYFFYEKIQFYVSAPILPTHEFWVSVAFLLYFAGNFFLFLYSKSMLDNDAFRKEYTVIYGSLTIIKDILLSVAILVYAYVTIKSNRLNDPINIDLGTFNPLQKKPNL